MIEVWPILPISAPRQVAKDAWDPSPHVQRYRAFRDEVRLRKVTIPTPYHHVIFVLPMPKSWGRRERFDKYATAHQQRPDRDNLEKALLDSIFGEDKSIWDGRTTKLWGEKGFFVVSDDDVAFGVHQVREWERSIR